MKDSERIAYLETRVAELEAENATLKAENAVLKERLSQIEEMLGLNSKNSSKPPSSDIKGKSKLGSLKARKRGGQKGHKGHYRKLWPRDKVKETILCPPQSECSCGGQVQVTGNPYIHESFELPEIEPVVTHYHIQNGRCQKCSHSYQGQLPDGIPAGILGPRLLGLSGLLSSHYTLSKEKICLLFNDLLGLSLSPGTLSKHEQLLSDSLVVSYDEIHSALQSSDVVHMDETGFRQGNSDGNNPEDKKAWLWTLMSKSLTLFKICLGRGQVHSKVLLGENFAGIVCTDRWGGYNWIPLEQRSLCWAHLVREFRRMSDRPGESGEIGHSLMEHGYQVFTDWRRYEAEEIQRSTFKQYVRGLRRNIRSLLEQGANYEAKKGEKSPRAQTASTCRSLLKVEPALWTFNQVEIESSNNRAERAIRPVVVWRKVCYGTQSERGSRLIERLFTVVSSCRQQSRSVLTFLEQSIQAHLGSGIRPSLVSCLDS